MHLCSVCECVHLYMCKGILCYFMCISVCGCIVHGHVGEVQGGERDPGSGNGFLDMKSAATIKKTKETNKQTKARK